DGVDDTSLQRQLAVACLPVDPCGHLLEGPVQHAHFLAIRPDIAEPLRGDLSQAIALEDLARAPLQLVLAHSIGIPEPRASHQRYASSTASGSDDVSMNGWTSQ